MDPDLIWIYSVFKKIINLGFSRTRVKVFPTLSRDEPINSFIDKQCSLRLDAENVTSHQGLHCLMFRDRNASRMQHLIVSSGLHCLDQKIIRDRNTS